jgi:hypothetical protein
MSPEFPPPLAAGEISMMSPEFPNSEVTQPTLPLETVETEAKHSLISKPSCTTWSETFQEDSSMSKGWRWVAWGVFAVYMMAWFALALYCRAYSGQVPNLV